MTADKLPEVTLTGGRIFRLPAEPTLEQDLEALEILNAAGLLLTDTHTIDTTVPLRTHVETAVVKLVHSGRAIPLLATLLVEAGKDSWEKADALQAIELFRKERDPVVKAKLLECLAPSVAGFFVNAMRSSGISLSSFPDLTNLNQTEAPSDLSPQGTAT